MRNPIAFHAKMMGDIMYLQQALTQPNVKEFVQAVIKEVNGHVDSNNEVEGIALFCVTLQCNHLLAVFTLVFVSTKSIVGYLAGGSFVVSKMLLHC